MPDLVPVRRALISVSDKTGLAEFATALVKEFNVALLSTGGTAKFLRDAGLNVTDVSDVTGFPEMMDGRVKTLHPKIHGGLLALRDHPEHAAAMQAHNIEAIDLVCINLYPFEQTVAKPGTTFEEAIENIDIGGPSMVRSAAKNHGYVAVVTAASQYDKVLGDLRKHGGQTCEKHRRKLAAEAFVRTGKYDNAIAAYFAKVIDAASVPAEPIALRYGENPHQKAFLHASPKPKAASVAHAVQHHGKELSYINVLDADAALAVVKEFDTPAACIVKHATPCGVGTGTVLAEAVDRAYASDPVAAFGGIVAVNTPLDKAAAELLTTGQKFLEVIVAPSYSPDALDLLKTRWKNVRLLEVGPMFDDDNTRLLQRQGVGDVVEGVHVFEQTIFGGKLVQQRDWVGIVDSEWKTVSSRQPTAEELADLKVAWLACKHVKSNAITIAKGSATVGIGGGQVDRVGAARIAVEKAGERAKGAVAASDAFFPFPDGPKLLIDAGVTAIVQPGGSVRDAETIDLCNARGVALVFTGRRHFRH
ncbi:MAG: bifunctional phosphoribosylaminoimidazolecarboxamide formyltransferase/IMP cyclohydrolase [Tepidisphaeraceae bacterium]